ncbi:Prp19-binding domain splicing factor [Gregarina niphandrodes]|uniref:Prp19-binding domain splicing factor n=1 Tax=Gregarina niphandrodes TaxID=110365 RepID=A0A023B4C9_GRENI|nr:Prp19-binding domain splicing factor [Gregarina niphandrodes]EZG56588.1 Prp19-binding domain splicing factor [Gregarina niphandrodes]|eukprot:XP_011131223.1 Prp19-binding domain splicing factor [Gregarina niphandrodes]
MEIKPAVKAQVERRKGRLGKVNQLPRYRAGQLPEYVNPDELDSSVGESSDSDASSESDASSDSNGTEGGTGPGPGADPVADEGADGGDGRVAVNDLDGDGFKGPDAWVSHPLLGYGGAEPALDDLVSESSSDDEPALDMVAVKPTFKGKSERQELEARRRKEELQEQLERLEAERQALEKAAETRQIVQDTLASERAEEERVKERAILGFEPGTQGTELPCDEIPPEDAKTEYKAWQQRELSRLKRDWVEAMTVQFGTDPGPIEKLLRLNDATEDPASDDEQRKAAAVPGLGLYLLLLSQEVTAAIGKKPVVKGKMGFMQKYYHRGAFYSDVTPHEKSFEKDFNAAVGEDRLDKTLLPKILQVRRGDFGKRSRSKYTHLVDQDTTDRTSAWGKSGGQKRQRDS